MQPPGPSQMPTCSTFSQPTIVSYPDNPTVQVLFPPGWTATVSAITHKPYNQLVACEWKWGDEGGENVTRKKLLINNWASPCVPMHVVDGHNEGTFRVEIQRERESDANARGGLKLRAYHSIDQDVSGEASRNETHGSARLKVISTEKPSTAPGCIFRILVQDAPSLSNDVEDDISITVKCLRDGIFRANDQEYDLQNIQGDILPGLPKGVQCFYYFSINMYYFFHGHLDAFILPQITTARDLTNTNSVPDSFLGVNIAFSPRAMYQFAQLGDLQDDSYTSGQMADAKSLGDLGSIQNDTWIPHWDKDFTREPVDGVIIMTAFTEEKIDSFVRSMEMEFGGTMYRLHLVQGVTYGTIAQPQMQYPGSPIVPIGVLVMGYDGDQNVKTRPDWATDGAFLATRKLDVCIPEFNKWLLERGPEIFPEVPAQVAADHLGARLLGRWKDGTPTELSPDGPDPSISGDDSKVNNFNFDESVGQKRCPFAAHVRKANPRTDIHPVDSVYKNLMAMVSSIRQYSVTYGPEVTDEEHQKGRTLATRGQNFVSYSSSIANGFKHQQRSWFNEPMFPPDKDITPGMNPVLGQTGEEDQGVYRYMTGTNPSSEPQVMIFPDKFVNPQGGGYFFVPSMRTMWRFVTKI
ncbi:hypothetical protein H0H87_002538 [Tephrocybe sp. NHM501043]|nr:hypothetical protein H0H87_002538 [Tephrocybe sp. NHM501043]